MSKEIRSSKFEEIPLSQSVRAALDSNSSYRSLTRLRLILRFLGGLDFLAVVVCFLPLAVVDSLHQLAGLGEFPAQPITGYLSRSLSAMYAAHGLTLCYVSGDVPRYVGLIRFLAKLSIVQGALLVLIDCVQRLPIWWILAEGPTLAGLGVCLLLLVNNLPDDLKVTN